MKLQFIKASIPLLILSILIGIAIGLTISFIFSSFLYSKANVGGVYVLSDGFTHKTLVIRYPDNSIETTKLLITKKPVKIEIKPAGFLEYENYMVIYNFSVDNLTLSNKQRDTAIKILFNFQDTRRFLESGYKIDRIKPVYYYGIGKTDKAFVVLTQDGKMCIVVVNLSTKKVEYLMYISKS